MVRCSTCSEPLPTGAEYCRECGVRVDDKEKEVTHSDDENTTSTRANGVGSQTPEPIAHREQSAQETIQGIEQNLESHERFVYAGAGLTILGALLPWVTVIRVESLGIQGDGLFTFILGVFAAAIVWIRPWTRHDKAVITAIGTLVFLVAITSLTIAAGAGLYLTLAGGIILAYAGARELFEIKVK